MRFGLNQTATIKQCQRLLALLITCALASNTAQALTLVEAIAAAKNNDNTYLAAMTAEQTAEAQRDQAASIWKPKVMLSASAGLGSNDTQLNGAQFSTPQMGSSNDVSFNTSIKNGRMTQVSISAEQPLFSLAKVAQSKQLSTAAQISDVQAQIAKQDLILRVSNLYFDAVLARNALKLINTELKATENTATEMKDRFDLGAITAIDLQEAKARLAELKALQLATQADSLIKDKRLQSSVGKTIDELSTQPEQLTKKVQLAPLQEWQYKAQHSNLALRMQMLKVQQTQAQAREYSPAAAANLSAVAQWSRQQLNGSGVYGTANSRSTNAMLGMQLNLPLYTGGYRSAKENEAQIANHKAQIELEGLKQQIEQDVQAAWLGIQMGSLRMDAYDEAKSASHDRLNATRVGLDVGQRTTQDLLNAHNQTAAVVLNAKKAQVDYFMSHLHLLALTHILDQTDIAAMLMP